MTAEPMRPCFVSASIFGTVQDLIGVPCKELREILLPAFRPCNGFKSSCRELVPVWMPNKGHVPRGFFGATGTADEVKLVLVFAEPGNPHPDEKYADASPEELFKNVCKHAYKSFRNGTDRFHENVKGILNDCWPNLSLDDQLRRTWLTESVLCSAMKNGNPTEGAYVRERVHSACVLNYLEKELAVLPHAVVFALGSKPQVRLTPLSRPYRHALHPSSRESNEAKRESWKAISAAVHAAELRT